MGKPAPGYDVRVIDFDGNEAAAGEEGDIALRGRRAGAVRRLLEPPDETAAVYRGDWYVTGDRAVRDEDGYLWFTGRADDVILSAAYRIGPFEVESALLEHAAVAESAVVGKPDPDRGQIVKAFVVLRPGHAGGDELARRAPGPRQAGDRAVQVPARDRVRRRAAEDAEREDQARGAAQARGGAHRGLGGTPRLLCFPGEPLFLHPAVQAGEQVAGPALHALVPLVGLVAAVQLANPGRISLPLLFAIVVLLQHVANRGDVLAKVCELGVDLEQQINGSA